MHEMRPNEHASCTGLLPAGEAGEVDSMKNSQDGRRERERSGHSHPNTHCTLEEVRYCSPTSSRVLWAWDGCAHVQIKMKNVKKRLKNVTKFF